MGVLRRFGMANFGTVVGGGGGGASQQTIVTGSSTYTVLSLTTYYYGFNDSTKAGAPTITTPASWGTISDNTFNLYSDTAFSSLYYSYLSSGASYSLILTIVGNQPNDTRWTTMTITNGATTYSYLRTAASFSQDAGLTYSKWAWTLSAPPTDVNPFGTTNGVTVYADWA